MLRANHFLVVVEIEEVAGEHIHGAYGKMHFARIDQVEVDQLQQSLTERRGVVIAGRGSGAGRADPRIESVRLEEAGLAERRREPSRVEIARLAPDIAIRCVVPDLA